MVHRCAFQSKTWLTAWQGKRKTVETNSIIGLGSTCRCSKVSVSGAAKYIVDKGIAEESAYPFKNALGKCQASTIKSSFFFGNVATCVLNATTESMLMMFLVRHGPVLLLISKKWKFIVRNRWSTSSFDSRFIPKLIVVVLQWSLQRSQMRHGTIRTCCEFKFLAAFRSNQ